jgi:HEAT repeat protein
MPRLIPFDSVLEALLNESNPFPAKYLHQFSDITPENLAALQKIWPGVTSSRKQNVLEDLEHLTDTDTLLSFDDLARSLIKDPDAVVRTLAIRLLWECEDKKLVPIFLDLLDNDPSPIVSAAAATALGIFIYLGELEEIPSKVLKEVEDGLLTASRQDRDALIRRRAIEALGASSRPEVPELIKSAHASSDPDWMVSALFAMARSNDPRWQKEVMTRLHHKNESVRSEAIQTAGELNLEAARPILLRQLEDEEDDNEIRHAIIWSLSQIGGEGVRERLEELIELSSEFEEEDFLEEALQNLSITEEMATFTMLDLDDDPDIQSPDDLEDPDLD